MAQLREFKKHLKRGNVYRRSDLEQWSNAVDRHLAALVGEGTLQKLSPGVYYYPKESVFGTVPPEETALVRTFLKDDRFLVTSPNSYNSLGVGTTQLYNKQMQQIRQVLLLPSDFFYRYYINNTGSINMR